MGNLRAGKFDGSVEKRYYRRRVPFAFRLAIGAVSLVLLATFGFWSHGYVSNAGGAIPVIEAPGKPHRVQPEDPGGNITPFLGQTVNHIIAGEPAKKVRAKIAIVPAAMELADEDLSPRDYRKYLNENTAEGDRVDGRLEEALSASASAQTGLNPGAGSVEQGLDVASTRPGMEVDPSALPTGTILAQLGAYEYRKFAESEWNQLRTVYGDMLAHRDWFIQEARSGGSVLFRLRVLGFSYWQEANDYCQRMRARRASCVPTMIRK